MITLDFAHSARSGKEWTEHMDANQTVLEIRGLGYRYPSPAGYVEAVKEANYRFTPGKSYAIMGRSGSGKTTLMSVMAGLDVPWKGEVLFNGASVAELDRHKYRRDNIGMIFQSFYLLPQLTARENVELSLELCGYAGDKKKRANELLAEVGLSEALGAKRSTKLSGGEQQRVAIARALVNNPSMIIADEPTGNLDPARSFEIMLLLEQINALGTTVLVVTHEKGLVDRFTKRVVALEAGKIVSDGMDGYYNYEEEQ